MSKILTVRMVLVFFSLFVAGFTIAQEGHPYDGTWRGTIGDAEQARPVVMIIDYNGDNLSGMINPGRNSYRFENAVHDAPNWTISVTTTARDGEQIAFSAVMHDIGSVNRYMEGTWKQGGQEFPFKITRE